MINTIQPHNTILSFLKKHINPHISKYINPYKYMWTIINKIYIKKNGLTPLTIDKVVSETKKSDTIFFFGSGFSVNEISNEEWDYFKSHNTISANWFHKRDIIPIDYYIVHEMHATVNRSGAINIRDNIYFKEYLDNLNKPCYKDSILFINIGINSTKEIINTGFLKNRKYVFYNNKLTKGFSFKKSLNCIFNNGIYFGGSIVLEAIHLSYIMGFKKIVLVGVDLYDSRYFWLNKDEDRDGLKYIGKSHNEAHKTYPYIMKHLDDIMTILKKEGVELYVYNPKSLLAEKLPIYKPEED